MALKKMGEESFPDPIIPRSAVSSVEQGDPFAIKFVGADFAVIFPYHCLLEAKVKDEALSICFSKGVEMRCYETNLLRVLDSIWNGHLRVIEANPSRMDEAMTEGEVVVKRLEYLEKADGGESPLEV